MKHKDNWKLSLQSGDEVTIPIGENSTLDIIIATVEYCPMGVVKITDKDGARHECFVKEIV